MRTLKLADADYAERIRGPLETSLIQLAHGTSETRTRPDHEPDVAGFEEWQEQWRSNSRLISQRLALIDAELQRICRDEVAAPQLNVFRDAAMVR